MTVIKEDNGESRGVVVRKNLRGSRRPILLFVVTLVVVLGPYTC
jgi:hypothetical protein